LENHRAANRRARGENPPAPAINQEKKFAIFVFPLA
jgi:hypothetical protein